MDKEKYQLYSIYRQEKVKLSDERWLVEKTLEDLKPFEEFTDSKEWKSVINEIKRYHEGLETIDDILGRKCDLYHINPSECNHEIIYDDNYPDTIHSYCAFCTKPFSDDEELDALVIYLEAIKSKRFVLHLFHDVIEYLVLHNFDYTEEGFIKALKIVEPDAIYDLEMVERLRLERNNKIKIKRREKKWYEENILKHT